MTFINDQAMVADGNAWGRVLSRIWRRHGPDARLTFYDQALESDTHDYNVMRHAQQFRAVMSQGEWHYRGLPDRSAEREYDRRFGQPHYGH